MGVTVQLAEPGRVRLSAPLAPNINHRETVFGGSASALAILAAWTVLHVKLRAQGISSRLVIQKNTMAYDAPIMGDFSAEAVLDDDSDWERFVNTLSRRKRARISVTSMVSCKGEKVGELTREFVALSNI